MGIVQDVDNRNKRDERFATIIMALAFAAIMVLAFVGLASGNSYDCQDIVVTVQPGESLWSIVEQYCSGDVRSAVSAFDVSTVTLQPGQQLQLP